MIEDVIFIKLFSTILCIYNGGNRIVVAIVKTLFLIVVALLCSPLFHRLHYTETITPGFVHTTTKRPICKSLFSPLCVTLMT